MFENLTHHAYLIVGPALKVVPEIKKQFAEAEIIHQAWPQLGIDDSRELRESQARKVGARELRVFLLEFASITIEAQQALLKTLEEPALGTKFFLIAPSVQMFLPTVLSRLQIITLDPAESLEETVMETAQKFLAASPEKRLAVVQKLIEENDTAAGSRTRALELVLALELELKQKLESDKVNQKLILNLQNLEQARDYLNDRAAAVRLILEHLALVL